MLRGLNGVLTTTLNSADTIMGIGGMSHGNAAIGPIVLEQVPLFCCTKFFLGDATCRERSVCLIWDKKLFYTKSFSGICG